MRHGIIRDCIPQNLLPWAVAQILRRTWDKVWAVFHWRKEK